MTDTVSENARSYKKPTPQPEPCTRFMSIRDGAAYLGLRASVAQLESKGIPKSVNR